MAASHPKLTFEQHDATIVAAKRSMDMDKAMRKRRRQETPEEREQRLLREAQLKRAEATANEVAIDRMVRANIEQYGP
jgi:hypothetical protein